MSLKSIKPIDDNKTLKDLPDGIFGYVGADRLHKYTDTYDLLSLSIRADINSTARKTLYYFRINKYSSDKITFSGYISGQADSLMNQKKDLLDVDIQVFPCPHDEYKHEREFDLGEKDLRIKPRYISVGIMSSAQWLVDVRKEISTLPTNNPHKDHKSKPVKTLKVDDAVKVKEWYERPLGILFIAITGAVLAAGVVYWLGWNK